MRFKNLEISAIGPWMADISASVPTPKKPYRSISSSVFRKSRVAVPCRQILTYAIILTSYSRYNAIPKDDEDTVPCGFRSNLSMHGFVILSESRFIFTETSLLEKPTSLITQSLNFNTSTHIIYILLLFLFVMNVNIE